VDQVAGWHDEEVITHDFYIDTIIDASHQKTAISWIVFLILTTLNPPVKKFRFLQIHKKVVKNMFWEITKYMPEYNLSDSQPDNNGEYTKEFVFDTRGVRF
jgi:hypothetical protein